MSILTDRLPDTVVIAGKECPIQTDFRIWLRFTGLAEDGRLSTPDKITQIIRLVYGYLPPKLDGALSALMEFYSADSGKKRNAQGGTAGQKRIFDYEADAEYIYAAFLQQYGIDLCTAALHWFQFKALFSALEESTLFVKIMGRLMFRPSGASAF